MPEAVKVKRDTVLTAELFDLLKAYAEQRKRTIPRVHVVKKRKVWSIKDARKRLERLVGQIGRGGWLQLDRCLTDFMATPEERRSAIASSFGATLEMARDGQVELRQDAPFAPIYVRGSEAVAE